MTPHDTTQNNVAEATSDEATNHVRAARTQVEGIRAALRDASPRDLADGLSGHLTSMEQAASLLRLAQATAESENAGSETQVLAGSRLVEELETLCDELRRAEHLARNGQNFWEGWARMLGLDTGYTPSAMPATMQTEASRPTVKFDALRVVVKG